MHIPDCATCKRPLTEFKDEDDPKIIGYECLPCDDRDLEADRMLAQRSGRDTVSSLLLVIDDRNDRIAELEADHTDSEKNLIDAFNTIRSSYDKLRAAARALRSAQRAYMADRGNELLGGLVAACALELDEVIGNE